jgi:GNAT superfamily N-acetyltransferase
MRSVEVPAAIRRASPHEGERLREIAIASKGYWGYDPERVRDWAASVDFSPEALRSADVYVAEVEGRLVGWASIVLKADLCWLDDLWIEPEWIGKGIGGRLFRHAAEVGRGQGAGRMEWEAEPNAIGFYEKMGGRYVRETEPNAWGRTLAVMGVDLRSGATRATSLSQPTNGRPST